ncbi:Tumor necrosis factor ligand superfamily member 13B B lymphocyte stimulator [Collichthys lucidus]|uniref:Tumor necrosis factor ligand superfamily member 13B B lymphocyte stimulator n=1 Tax=Collichthys lucidus TaxID=240159 RepID=A0A4U5TZW3_COLLU|nr:Tumor necrosis factor ligand superfamily member 13B B lymphocyte stimulator [Collichthys lucidus]
MAGVEAGTGQRAGEGRLSWPVFLLTLAAVTSSSLSALSLYQLMALRAEVEGLKSEVVRRREESQEVKHASQTENMSSRRSIHEPLHQPGSPHAFALIKKRSLPSEASEFESGPHTGIPWQSGLKRGSALEPDGDSILVREEGFYFVYSQIYYMDSTFAMGHVVIRRKRNVVGDEDPYVILFRCIQSMNPVYPFNTCYTGGIVKLEAGDHLELLIPRSTANVSLDGDATFLGAVKLA